MALNLLKPALKIEDVTGFVQRQKKWIIPYNGREVYPVWTSRKPARLDEMLDGGSVFWIVKKRIQCRQNILDFVELSEADAKARGKSTEKPSYLFLCDPQLVRVEPIEKRPFQGWRYLEGSSAPRDIGVITDESDEAPPAEMEKELREAGLL